MLLGLSHEGAYTSRCQMPEFEQFKVKYIFKREMVCRLATTQNHLDLCPERGRLMFVMEGMLEGEQKAVRLLPARTVLMVPPF